jgi:hypothetical protein
MQHCQTEYKAWHCTRVLHLQAGAQTQCLKQSHLSGRHQFVRKTPIQKTFAVVRPSAARRSPVLAARTQHKQPPRLDNSCLQLPMKDTCSCYSRHMEHSACCMDAAQAATQADHSCLQLPMKGSFVTRGEEHVMPTLLGTFCRDAFCRGAADLVHVCYRPKAWQA